MRRVPQEPPELVVVVLWLPFSCSELPPVPPELVVVVGDGVVVGDEVVVGDVLPLSLVVCGEPPPLLVVCGSVLLLLAVCGELLAVLVVCGELPLCEELLPVPVGLALDRWPGL
jgi:hypothetical protein